MSANGTSHHKIHIYTGWGLIIGLPFAICGTMGAIGGGSEGLSEWLSVPISALGFSVFFAATLWYCKLEFDNVILDYFDGGLRRFGLLANRVVACLIGVVALYAVLQFTLLG